MSDPIFQVANLFEPSVDAAVNAIKRQVEASRGLIKSVFLVGGYAASPWLFQYVPKNLSITKPTLTPLIDNSKNVSDHTASQSPVQIPKLPKRSQMARSGSTAITTSPLVCPSLCTESSFYVRWTRAIRSMRLGGRGCVSFRVDQSCCLMRLIVFLLG